MEALEKILSAASALFKQYGFKSITMDDIAHRAGISKKTLYQHFVSKQEVVLESVLWYSKQKVNECRFQILDSENAIEAMVRMLAFMDEMNHRINPMALFELQRYFPQAYDTFREVLIEKDVVMIRENIEQGMLEGIYRSGLNADLLARYRLETSLMALQPNLMVNDRNDLMTVALEVGEHFMYGIMNEEGARRYKTYKEKYLNPKKGI